MYGMPASSSGGSHDELPKFLFRGLSEGEDPALGLFPMDGLSISSIDASIGVGLPSQFIHTSKSLSVATWYAAFAVKGYGSWSPDWKTKTGKVAMIDVSKVLDNLEEDGFPSSTQIIDLTSPAGCLRAGIEEDSRAFCCALGHREVLLQGRTRFEHFRSSSFVLRFPFLFFVTPNF